MTGKSLDILSRGAKALKAGYEKLAMSRVRQRRLREMSLRAPAVMVWI